MWKNYRALLGRVRNFTTANMSVNGAKVTEGSATILFNDPDEVFYNPVQQFNRDMSTTAIRTWAENRDEKAVLKAKHRQEIIEAHEKKDENEDKGKSENPSPSRSEETTAPAKNSENNTGTDGSSNVGFNVLEALSATGLRAIRYAKELPNVKKILANDLLARAVEAIDANVKRNDVSHIVVPNKGDANSVMHSFKNQYDVIDLDPYGTATPFLDSAVQSVANNGLLCITCTDSAVLAGNAYPEKCFSNYGGTSLRSDFCHEQAVRHLLYAIAAAAAKYGRAIKPMLSLSVDFYFRVFVQVETKPALVKDLHRQSALIYHCSGCGSNALQYMGKTVPGRIPGSTKYTNATGPPVAANCEHCGYVHHVGGPVWGGPLHDAEFVERMRKIAESLDEKTYGTKRRILGMLAVVAEELSDKPFYFIISQIASVLRAQSPPQSTFVSALLNAGYRASGSHAKSNAIKTDAPWSYIWDIMRAWVAEHPVNSSNIKPNSAGSMILKKECSSQVDFTLQPGAEFSSKKGGYTRYQMNPTENWGPKAKAGKRKIAETDGPAKE
ncbi:tRNA (guanine-N2-)-methyltransferase Trm1 [Schizosaccharomyces osmophilus]|uniref:tRNA (guanine(26)-N(2))-dimethyltransferase n=1 Tax=Schizosaccharomyces osmophilus TaxID=2545709 RepID=A0AAF0AUH3_9SCHI|nr:tRNA (guanine-N2-)-methyltransferase Trm1 [Schizosaccharomyces osmophilus]WBW71627.1 tRNA (guanine-N2-)-methyltransferase Trm1 [Schizosaccharomyces osmophilus]